MNLYLFLLQTLLRAGARVQKVDFSLPPTHENPLFTVLERWVFLALMMPEAVAKGELRPLRNPDNDPD